MFQMLHRTFTNKHKKQPFNWEKEKMYSKGGTIQCSTKLKKEGNITNNSIYERKPL